MWLITRGLIGRQATSMALLTFDRGKLVGSAQGGTRVSNPVLVVGAIIVDDPVAPTSVLAAQRNDPPALAGRWEFPGGKVESEEGPEAGLKREIREELGIEITLGPELANPRGAAWPISESMIMRTWLASTSTVGRLSSNSHRELRWLRTDDLWSVDWLDVDALVVVQLVLESVLGCATRDGAT